MQRSRIFRSLATLLVLGCSGIAGAAGQSRLLAPGQYQVQGGTYMVTLEVEGSNMVAVEPNRRSVYTPQADGSYHFRNPTNGIVYGMRSAGEGIIEAFKPDNPGNPTRLVLINGSTAAPEVDERWVPLAEKYRDMMASDPANTQTWMVCSAVALKRSVSSEAEADRYARQMADTLKQISVAPDVNPCGEVFIRGTW